MKVLFKVPEQFAQSRKIHLDLDLNLEVKEVRRRLGRIIDVPLSCFQLVTKVCRVTILLTDS